MAVDDIGLAAEEALNFCLSANPSIEFLKSPEGDPALAEPVAHMARASKSNLACTAGRSRLLIPLNAV